MNNQSEPDMIFPNELKVRKYRKKPIVIEAIQWLGHNWNDVCKWGNVPHNMRGKMDSEAMVVEISTKEGEMIANINDWIIKGIAGEFYPCKPDIFEKTYELVDDK